MSEHNRRKLLKTITAGSGAIIASKALPEAWTRPVVDSVLLPAHAETTDTPEPCTPCVDAATYCEGSGQGIGEGRSQVMVAADGTVTFYHPVATGVANVDPCTGGSYVIEIDAPDGPGVITISGTIPCGVVESIQATIDDGQQDPIEGTYSKGACVVDG